MPYNEHNAEDSCLKNQHRACPAQDESIKFSPSSTSPPPLVVQRGDPEKSPSAPATAPGLEYAETTSTENHEPNLDFPEGGLQAWLVVFGSFCGMFSVYGLINTAAVFESYFSENQLKDYSSSQIGWIFSLYLFMVFIVGIQVGPVFDKYGPRLIVLAGGLLIATSLFILSVCQGE